MKNQFHHDRSLAAFTLIEMLTVITIMSIIAAMIVTMAQSASQKKKIVAVDGEKERLVNLIENYKAKLNFYPPDNGGLISNTADLAVYDGMAATNQLMYELMGVTNVPGSKQRMLVFNSPDINTPLLGSEFAKNFNRGGVANCDPSEPNNFFLPGPLPKEYTNYDATVTPPICGLLVPTEFTNVRVANFWHYDSSTTNRHNITSYDLWAEYSIGSKSGRMILKTNGNNF
ncbi:MAG TPA: type II secretion system protein [Verrucomicrobiae bacterium]|jgi:prepilin-type N-terminal cleavage/methylation domain-containing protein